MARVGSYDQLRKTPDKKLIQLFDTTSEHTDVGLSFLRDELARRESEKQYDRMLNLTQQMHWMTIFITIMTAVNVIAIVEALIW